MGKVFVIISGKGGVGKTTSAINIGSSINSLGKDVIVADANLTTPNIGLHLGSPIVPITINHVISNKARAEDAIYQHESGMKILPASLSLSDLEDLNYSRLPDIAKRLRKIADYTILDSAAGLGEEARYAMKAADEVIIITNPEMSAITDALKTIKLAEQMKKDICGCIITRHTGNSSEMDIPTISDMLEIPILGIIPEDNAIKESQKIKDAVIHTHPKSKSAKAYHKVVKKLLGPDYFKKEQKIEKVTESFLNKFLKKLGLKR